MEYRLLPQDRETPLQGGRAQGFAWRYAYARAAETRAAGDLGQDYLAFRQEGDAFAFALCDGVGQSFFGDLAARFLGDALLEWLWAALPGVRDEEIEGVLQAHLGRLAQAATPLVQAQELPRDTPKLLREVLEWKRDKGSETTFVCGRVDLPKPRLAGGRTAFAWLGDSRLRLWQQNAERSGDLGKTFHTSERWSSRDGAVGEHPHVFAGPLSARDVLLTAFAAYSDGLARLDSLPQLPSSPTLARMIRRVGERAAGDDISLLEVRIDVDSLL